MKSYWRHFFLDNGDISLIEAGIQKYIPQQINNYKVKHDYVFHLVHEGKGIYQVNGQTYHLQAGDGFILKKNHQVFYIPDDDDPWTISWIGFGGNNIQRYLQNTRLNKIHSLTFPADSLVWETMNDYIQFLWKCDPNNTSDYLQIFSKLYQLLAVYRDFFVIKEDHSDAYSLMEPRLAEKVYEYIYENFMQTLTVQGIAEQFDISRNYLFKICKEYYQQSPKQIILELRMNQAQQLLRGSQKRIKEIAQLIGYKDPFTFSKMFKEYYNYSPSEFRKLSESEIEEALFIRERFLKPATPKHLL